MSDPPEVVTPTPIPSLKVGEDAAELKRTAARRVIVLSAILLILYYLLFVGFQGVPEVQAVFVPVVLLGLCLLMASLTSLLLVGFLVPYLRAGLIWLGVALFFGLILISLNGTQPGLNSVGVLTMGLGALIFVACLAQGYNTHAWIVLRGLSLIVLGLVLDMGAQVLASPLEQLGAALLLAFAFVGVISLGGLMFAHSNPSLRRIGTLLSSSLNILLLAVLTALLTIYLMVFRPLLETNYEPLMVLIEWLAVALVAAIIGIRFYLYFRRRSAPPVMGDWTVLVQKVSFEEGDLARATAAVRAFIDKGRKEGMVVLLTSTLVANHVPEERVEKIMQRIINYQQPRFSLLFRWTYGDLEGNLRQARAQMVVAALQEAAEEVGARYLSSGLQVGREKKVQEA